MEISSNKSYKALCYYLNKIGIRVSAKTLKDSLNKHPFKDGVRGISDTLDGLRVEHLVCQLTTEQLEEIETPFIVFTTTEKDPIGIVNYIGEKINVYSPISGNLDISRDVFNRIWTGIVIAGEKGENTYNENWITYFVKQCINWVEENIFLLCTICFILILSIGIFNNQTFNIYETLIYVIKVSGVGMSAIIIYKTYFNRNILKRFCQIGTTVDCNSVLNSKVSKFFDWIGFGELSFIYFLSTLLWGIFLTDSPLSIYIICSGIAFLFTIFSIIWQGFIAKKWCLLCMIVNLIIVLELVVSSINYKTINISVLDFTGLAICFIFSLFCWIIFRDLLFIKKRKQRLDDKNIELLSDLELFNLLLNKSSKVQPYFSFAPLSNNIESSNNLLIITNPSCGICAKLHEEVKTMDNNLNINLIIALDNKDKKGKDAALKIISTYQKDGWEKAFVMMEHWFHYKRTNEDVIVSDEAHFVLEKHQEYCRLIKLKGTPLVVIKGHVLPRIYELEDLKLLL
ncbi:putative membrane protein [Dysgonomonas sp. PFB1-18]|uniref:vitamin K epoxide reductase family protein n=1 Tax=unclassified Dysgonomonas TaxID=2630389 RepID=UPI0024763B62|nr:MULTISPECIES: vitamin K epoxide reductase family protein [unclassified Dysgonomonas]MDH6309943.1 putative membrane protein [Dysgonomonas sp. PF1-14]MDH6339853.1 putative membrane protein [Dysgonomonas sp. PF1-16]MDH6381501.1 putative membrane protein [Dysgonomonas sp. PFB1-18]MDH6398863.1 putative membrane protein [Dysgonomonas sp. PF1-23]